MDLKIHGPAAEVANVNHGICIYYVYSKIIEYYERWMNYSCFELKFNFAHGCCTIHSSMLLGNTVQAQTRSILDYV